MVHPGFRIGHPFLNQNYVRFPDVLRDNDVRTSEHQIIRAGLSPVVDHDPLLLQVFHATACVWGSEDRSVEYSATSQMLQDAIGIIRREPTIAVGEFPGDLMHLCGLIHRSTNEQDVFGFPVWTLGVSSHRPVVHFPPIPFA